MEIALWIIAVLVAINVVNGLCNSYDEHRRWSRIDKRQERQASRDETRYSAWLIEKSCSYDGMRDAFAVAIISGLLSDQREGSAWSTWGREDMATEAYLRADAMLAARAPKAEPQ